jgi:hypothetical protein
MRADYGVALYLEIIYNQSAVLQDYGFPLAPGPYYPMKQPELSFSMGRVRGAESVSCTRFSYKL